MKSDKWSWGWGWVFECGIYNRSRGVLVWVTVSKLKIKYFHSQTYCLVQNSMRVSKLGEFLFW